MKLIAVTELARDSGISRKRMRRWLRAYEHSNRALRGMLVVRVGPRGQEMVNVDLFKRLESRAQRVLHQRVAQLEAWARGMDTWRDEIDAQRFTGRHRSQTGPFQPLRGNR